MERSPRDQIHGALHPVRSVRVIRLIEVITVRGSGVEGDPVRMVLQVLESGRRPPRRIRPLRQGLGLMRWFRTERG